MTEKKRFPLRVLLSVTTGRLLTKSKGPDDNGISDIYELLGWMTNDSPFTHQLPRFAEECIPHLLQWFPELKQADNKLDALDEIIKLLGPERGCGAWLGGFQNILPTHLDVPRIPADKHKIRHPITELVEMMSKPKEGESK